LLWGAGDDASGPGGEMAACRGVGSERAARRGRGHRFPTCGLPGPLVVGRGYRQGSGAKVRRRVGRFAANRVNSASRKCMLEGRGTWEMDVSLEIAKQVEKLPPDMQEQVLRFVASLSASAPVGEKGARLRQFSSSLDSVSARQMIQAIDEECERVDPSDW